MSPRIGLDLNTIVKAAAEIADADGLEAVTLATLSRKLNIRPPSLYNHIEGLPGLRKELALYGIEELERYLSRAAAERAGDDAVRAMGEAYLTFARRKPGLYEATFYTIDMEDTDIKLASEKIVNLVIQVLQQYGLHGVNAVHATRGFRSILHGFASIEQKGGFAMELDINESFYFLIETFLIGIKK
ncbi:TetR-like C-terminal domain-containing protein [Cytobacillus solani]|uniref:TetR family transcriptional regulator n=1 Tax=Cytobacillus solani TaxID=1637975 RepID=A0A0Q3SJK0_9BACI|nr:TetR-like C-terminal domain-containing protein [Cytobacillus solani]KOP82865.1 TetR family transcriptional regulator [Bacillus sp. FJAT-21945]KQL19884.1 TetR family transcriptional regulator [Cytobacillus solani]USK53125.1 WHG domain-containing protein [Cytobacillus solani]